MDCWLGNWNVLGTPDKVSYDHLGLKEDGQTVVRLNVECCLGNVYEEYRQRYSHLIALWDVNVAEYSRFVLLVSFVREQ